MSLALTESGISPDHAGGGRPKRRRQSGRDDRCRGVEGADAQVARSELRRRLTSEIGCQVGGRGGTGKRTKWRPRASRSWSKCHPRAAEAGRWAGGAARATGIGGRPAAWGGYVRGWWDHSGWRQADARGSLRGRIRAGPGQNLRAAVAWDGHHSDRESGGYQTASAARPLWEQDCTDSGPGEPERPPGAQTVLQSAAGNRGTRQRGGAASAVPATQ